MALFNPASMVKAQLLKADMNKNKIPDVIEGLDAAEAACDWLADYLAEIDKDEAVTILTTLNNLRKPEKRRSAQEIGEAAGKLVLLPALLRQAEATLQSVENGLQK